MILGTAGHIDHGKSALIEALTGHPMDRLAEERRRGITIDLNFTRMDLGGGLVAGVIDVPGHEDFIRTMAAGASGVDLMLLVVAADEGIMPQTREHLLIAERLGIRAGIPVLTKTDLVEPEWRALVAAEINQWLAGSAIPFAPAVAVSARTGDGLDELRTALREQAARVLAPGSGDLFRMPLDRAFTIAGIGTVVTGTCWSGTVRVGDTIRLLPRGVATRVRSLEVYGEPAEQAGPATRVALNLAGVERGDVRRGDVLVHEDSGWRPATRFDARLQLVDRDGPVRGRVRVLHGTAEYLARLQPAATGSAGGETLTRLVLEQPAVLRAGDRFVLRTLSPVRTIGGGVVVDPFSPPRSRPGDLPATAGLAELVARRPRGVPRIQLPLLSGTPPEATDRALEQSVSLRTIGDVVIGQGIVDHLQARILAAVQAWHAAHPDQPGMPLPLVRQLWRGDAQVVDRLLEELAEGRHLTIERGVARASGFRPATGDDSFLDRLVARIADAGLTPPTAGELVPDRPVAQAIRLLRQAVQDGRLAAVEPDRFYARTALTEFEAVLRDMAAAGPLTPAAIRDRLGVTRKFLIPLLEWADREGITVRTPEGRRLRSLPRTSAQS